MNVLFALALTTSSPEYLQRPVPRGPRFLDHGVVAVGVAAGTPHLYRFDLRVGLFDHLSLGVTGHWLPGQRAPQIWPVAALALWRWRSSMGVGVELGAHYRPVLFPPVDLSQTFVPATHLGLASVVLAAGLVSAGLDLGFAHARLPVVDPNDVLTRRDRVVFAGGPFVRVGNRRLGIGADAVAVLSPDPLLVFEVAVDVRIGAFERRPAGGWRDP